MAYSLLSKNLENGISQNGKSEKHFYAPFYIHMVVEFQKSKLPTMLHFLHVKLPYQPLPYQPHVASIIFSCVYLTRFSFQMGISTELFKKKFTHIVVLLLTFID